MGKQNDVGVFQLENGKWAFRYTFTKNGKRSSKRSCKDEFGNSLNTKRAAIKARQIAVDAEALNQPLKPVERKTVAEVVQVRHIRQSENKILFGKIISEISSAADMLMILLLQKSMII